MAPGEQAGPIKLGMVGCGWISDWHGRAVAALPDAEFAACCDTNLEAAAAWQRRHGGKQAYDSLERMLAEHELDAVVLATWPSQHLQQMLTCIDAEIGSILCEKPLTVSVEDAVTAFRRAREAGVLVMEGYMYRHHPATKKIMELVESGEIGMIDRVNAAFDVLDPEVEGPDEPRGWRQRKELYGGVPFDLAGYCIDFCNQLAGDLPSRTLAVTATSPRYGTIARFYALIEYENGVVGAVNSSNKSDFDFELKVNGSQGNVILPLGWTPNAVPPRERVEDGEHAELLLRRSTGIFSYDTTPLRVPGADPYALQMRSFVAAIKDGREATPTVAESVLNIATVNAALKSAERGEATAITVPDDLREELGGSK